jgi:hypothetical protein
MSQTDPTRLAKLCTIRHAAIDSLWHRIRIEEQGQILDTDSPSYVAARAKAIELYREILEMVERWDPSKGSL